MPILQKIHKYTNNNGDIHEENLEFNSDKGGVHMKKHNDNINISLIPPMLPGSACSTARLLNPSIRAPIHHNKPIEILEDTPESKLEGFLKYNL